MSNDLTPSSGETPEQNAISQLKSSTGSALTISQAPNGEWILTSSSELRPSQLRLGIERLDEALRGGPKDRIRNAITELLGATDRPPSVDETGGAARTMALLQMAWDYPIDVVERACRKWRKIPSYGRWWPTEQDLRAQCEEIGKSRRELREHAARLLKAMEENKQNGPVRRSVDPIGRTLEFVEAVRATHGHDFVKSWLNPHNCRFTNDTIYTIGLGVERLQMRCGGYLDKYGIKVLQCPDVTKSFYDYVDREITPFSEPKKKKKAWKEHRAD